MMAATQSWAAGTLSGTSVDNRATIAYEVAGAVQPIIESSPTGNSTPGAGAGADTSFVIDNLVDLTVTESNTAATPVNPGQAEAVTTFLLENSGNTAQGYAFTASNLTTGASVHGNADLGPDANNLRVFVDANANGTYEAGTDTLSIIDTLAADGTATIFIVVDIPIGASNLDVANVRLRATTHDAGTGAASPTAATAGADTAGIDVVFGDGGNDGFEEDDDGYTVSSADLTISKTSTVIWDPFNLAANPKAIPGAQIEYSILLSNNGLVAADSVLVTDIVAPDLTLLLAQYNGNLSDVRVEVGTTPTVVFCTADNGDGDADGCGLTGGTLEVSPGGSLTVGTTAADNPVRVLFRATID
jgi:uncharacterized repeat protein (TIGR01451 family)